MTPLLLTLTLTTPAQPPLFRQPASPAPPAVTLWAAPNIRTLPQVSGSPYRQPGIGPSPVLPAVPVVVPVQPIQPIVPGPQALTLAEFSRFFTPTPGPHSVWLIHPVTQQPVLVNFTLPNGKLREFRVDRRAIRFEFNCGDVEILFRTNGTVRIDYFY